MSLARLSGGVNVVFDFAPWYENARRTFLYHGAKSKNTSLGGSMVRLSVVGSPWYALSGRLSEVGSPW